MARFEGSMAIVTGAGSGLGRATATLLAEEGATVACVDIHAGAAGATAVEIGDLGGKAFSYGCDVSDPDAVRRTVDQLAGEHGRPTILCNIAAVQQWGHTMELPFEDWNRILAVNLTGTFLMCQATLPYLTEGGGAIVNVGSTAGLSALPYDAAYCASKAGVLMLTRSLAIEFSGSKVRVNAVAPGGMETPMLYLQPPEGASEDLLSRVDRSLFGVGKPEQVARVIAFLVSSDADYMSGAVVPVDGAAMA
jgi:NAD(P)-dependent dehydrogenase (short-subunit alcohol dehydrogenase family)